MSRLYLSPPHMTGRELELVREAFASNWIAPLGPQVDAFEREFAEAVDMPHAAALVSGTAALHLALRLVGVGPGDEVLCPTLTFVATANAVLYLGAQPIFVDSSRETWNLDPALLADELDDRCSKGRPPRAVVAVDLYGQSADYGPLLEICDRYGVALIEDAAEALGATYRGTPVGSFGRFGVFSFNGNKIITTSGGGMLVSVDGAAIEEARHLASQARDPGSHYQHSKLGYNYRLSNLLAAVGRAQLEVLPDRVATLRRNFSLYESLLGDLPGVAFMPEAPYGRASRWLTCLTIDPDELGVDRETIRLALEDQDIESRPVWKPLHLLPLYADRPTIGGAVAEELFSRGLCLPSGSSLTEEEIRRVCSVVRSAAGAASPREVWLR